MESDRPLISIVVPVFNRRSTLQRCLDSVASQGYPRKELVVVDGSSTDGTVDLLRENADKIQYWESKPDTGVYHAINRGIDHARGTWITILGADDFLWDSTVLARLVAHHEQEGGGHKLVHGQVAQVDEAGRPLRFIGGPREAHTDLDWGEVPIPTPGLLVHRTLFERYGKFDESYRIAADFDFILRVTRAERALFVPHVVSVGMTIGGMSSSVKNTLIQTREVRRVLRLHGVKGHPDPVWGYPMRMAHFATYTVFGPRGHGRLVTLYRRMKAKLTLAK